MGLKTEMRRHPWNAWVDDVIFRASASRTSRSSRTSKTNMSVTKRDLPEIHVRRETKYGMDPNAGGINYNHVPEEYLLSLSDDSGKLMHGGVFCSAKICTMVSFGKTLSERFPFCSSWTIQSIRKKVIELFFDIGVGTHLRLRKVQQISSISDELIGRGLVGTW